MNINEIEAGWGEFAFVWVRPSEGRSWFDHSRGTYGEVSEYGWRPAMVTGFQDADSREFYDTQNDPRRVFLIGKTYGYRIQEFEYMEMEPAPEARLDMSSHAVLPKSSNV